MATVGETKGENHRKMRRNSSRREAAPGSIVMDFVDRVIDLGAKEITVTGVASVERISKGMIRVTYFISRNGTNTVAVHLIWDCQLWLDVFQTWWQAHDSIVRECLDSGCGTKDERTREMH